MRLLAFAALIVSSSAQFTDCDGSQFSDCTVFGVDGSSDCNALIGDGVCDWGQRILSNGDPGPNLMCAQFEGESADCDCPNGTLTCSGYCLSDADCASEYWGKTDCLSWRRDDVCDFGQRSSDANIEIHFECDRWNWDNGACDQNQTCDDILTAASADQTCPDPSSINNSWANGDPTPQPSYQPTSFPTSLPSLDPTQHPTLSPSNNPTTMPTEQPTNSPIEFRECVHDDDPDSRGYILDCQDRCVPRRYFGDGICDWGQRTIRTQWDFDFRCPELNMDDGDCQCPMGTITCDGYCLTDEQCSSEYFQKSSCVEWSLDNICDFGQRVADSGIEINFECMDWNYDNLACSREPQECVIDQAFADATCDPGFPTTAPTHYPTSLPSRSPSEQPTDAPTTSQPTEQPTTFPTQYCPEGLVDCDGNCWQDCRSSWLPGHREDGAEGCYSYIGDGVCDMGQRLLRFEYDEDGNRSNYWGPNLDCHESVMNWGSHMNTATNPDHPASSLGGWDGGDCDRDACAARGGVMTCDGFCLTDADCVSESLGYTTCMEWKNDSVCDYGQRYSDAMININFNCDEHAGTPKPPQQYRGTSMFGERWGDNGWCQPPEEDDTCATVLAECPEPVETYEPTQQPTNNPTAFFSDCDGTIWQDSDECLSSWIPGHRASDCGGETGVSCCDSYIGDGVCDWGQRLIRSGRLGPNLQCAKFGNDGGDCECDASAGMTMTCDGFCVSDEDCASDYFGYTACSDWWEDDICDHGQRFSNIQLNMNFNCEETVTTYFNYDQGSCAYDGPDDQVCEWILEQECEMEPTPDPTYAPVEEPVVCTQEAVTCWDQATVMSPDPRNDCQIPDCPPCPDDTQRCPDDPTQNAPRNIDLVDPTTGVGCQFDFSGCPVDPCRDLPAVPAECDGLWCNEYQQNGDGCDVCSCVPGNNTWCAADMGPGLMDSPAQSCDAVCSDAQCGEDECAMRSGDCCEYTCMPICDTDMHTCETDGATMVERDPNNECNFRIENCPGETPRPSRDPTSAPSLEPTEAWDQPLAACYEVANALEETCAWRNLADTQDRAQSDLSRANCERACAIDPNCAGIQYRSADINGQGRDCDLIDFGCNFALISETENMGEYDVASKYCFNVDCPTGEYWEASARRCKPVTACSYPADRSTRAFCNGNGEPREGDGEDAGTCICACDEGFMGDRCQNTGMIEFVTHFFAESNCSTPLCEGDEERSDCPQPTALATVEGNYQVQQCFALNNDGIGEAAKVSCSNGRLAMSIFGGGDVNCENPPIQNIVWDDQASCVDSSVASGDLFGESTWDGTGCPRVWPACPDGQPRMCSDFSAPPCADGTAPSCATEVCPDGSPRPVDGECEDLGLCGCFGYYAPAHAGSDYLCRSHVGDAVPQCFTTLDENDPTAQDSCPMEATDRCARACDDNGNIIYKETPCRPEPRGRACETSRDCGQDEYCETVFFDENDPQANNIMAEDPSLSGGRCISCPNADDCADGRCTYEDLVCCGNGWGRTFMGEESQRMCSDGETMETRMCEQINLGGRFIGRWAEADSSACPVDIGCDADGFWGDAMPGATAVLTCPQTPEAIERCDVFGWAAVEGCEAQGGPFQLTRTCIGNEIGWDAARPGVCPGLTRCPAMDGFPETNPGSAAMKTGTCPDGREYMEWRNCELAMPGACANDNCWETAYINYEEYPWARDCHVQVDVCAELNNRRCDQQVGICGWCGDFCRTLVSAGGEGCPAAAPAHPCEDVAEDVCVDPLQNGGLHCEISRSDGCIRAEYAECDGLKKNVCARNTLCVLVNGRTCAHRTDVDLGICEGTDGFSVACDVQGWQATCESEAGCAWRNYRVAETTPEPTAPPAECADQTNPEDCANARFTCAWEDAGPDSNCYDTLQGSVCAEEELQACPNYGEDVCDAEYGNCCAWHRRRGCEALEQEEEPTEQTCELAEFGCDCAKQDKKTCKRLKNDPEACAANQCCKAKGNKCVQMSKSMNSAGGSSGASGSDKCSKGCRKQKNEKKCRKCRDTCAWNADNERCEDL